MTKEELEQMLNETHKDLPFYDPKCDDIDKEWFENYNIQKMNQTVKTVDLKTLFN